MATTSQPMLSSQERPVGFRTRGDLQIYESRFQGEPSWIVKDPVALKYSRLGEAEFLVLQELRAETTYAQLVDLLEDRYPRHDVPVEMVQQFVVSLFRSGLLLSESGGQADFLVRKARQERRQKLLGMATSLVSLRFPGWDPDLFLSWLYPKLRFFFSWWFTIIVAVTCIGAGGLVLLNFDTLLAKLPDFHRFFDFNNLLLLALLMVFTKSVHELGHALMCKHFKGECHEIGFMLLVGTPAMYCDTSDSWILANRWHRAAIGAAGMYVEVFMAAVCTFIWWNTHPGWLHYLALNIVFLSSVSTILFNANPLLRYDGYFILSDLLEIPNLAQKASTAMLSTLRAILLGIPRIDSPFMPEKHLGIFAVYGVASFLYRWFVLLAICGFITAVLTPYGLQAFGHVLIAINLVSLVAVPAFRLIRYSRSPGRFREVNSMRLGITLCCAAVLLGAFVFVPVPQYVWAPFIVRPKQAQLLVVHQPGLLKSVSAEQNDRIEAGQTVARLTDDTLLIRQEELSGEIAKLQSQLAALMNSTDPRLDAPSRIAETQAMIRSRRRQLELARQQAASLNFVAERAGTLFSPLSIAESAESDARLPTWSQTPLRQENIGTFLDRGVELGMIGNADQLEAVLHIAQVDLELVNTDDPVVLHLDDHPAAFQSSSLSHISSVMLESVPPQLSQTNGGPLAVTPNSDTGAEEAVLGYFEARADINTGDDSGQLSNIVPGMVGVARIQVERLPLASRLYRFVLSQLRF